MRERLCERLELASGPGAARDARAWLLARLDGAGWHPVAAQDLALALSEACTNAVRHGYGDGAGGSIAIDVAGDADEVRVVVVDRGRGFDLDEVAARERPELAENGLGLALMHLLSDVVDVRSAPGGTSVTLIKRNVAIEDA